jgi:O-Antigen ligase
MDWLVAGLSYAVISMAFVVMAVLALVGLWVGITTAFRVTAGAWAIGVAFLIETAFVAAPSLPVGLQLSTNDLAFGLLAASLAVRVLFIGVPRDRTAYLPWLALGGVFFFSLVTGLMEFGTKAGVEARPNFYFWMAGLYFAGFSYPPDVLKKLQRVLLWCGWGVVLVVIYRWVGLKYGFVSHRVVEEAGAGTEFRVVGSGPALFLAFVGIAYLAIWLRGGRLLVLGSAAVMLGLVLVLQHRSVWVATLGGLAVLAWHERSTVSRKLLPILAMGLATVALVATFIAVNPSSRLLETITNSATSATKAQGTQMDRLLGWEDLLTDFARARPRNWVIGKPYGTGYRRFVQGREEEYSPHNFFVQLMLRLGIAGLLLFLWTHFALRRQLRLCMSSGAIHPGLGAAFLAILAASLLYYIPYQGFYLQGAFYGLLISCLTAPSPSAKSLATMRPAQPGVVS